MINGIRNRDGTLACGVRVLRLGLAYGFAALPTGRAVDSNDHGKGSAQLGGGGDKDGDNETSFLRPCIPSSSYLSQFAATELHRYDEGLNLGKDAESSQLPSVVIRGSHDQLIQSTVPMHTVTPIRSTGVRPRLRGRCRLLRTSGWRA
jgi:hypothetical protein